MSAQPQTIAGIVIYHPDEANLLRLVGVIVPDVREIVIYANSEVSPQEEKRLRDAAAGTLLTMMRPEGNLGLGTAYNDLLDHAVANGATFLLLLDQDSLPPLGTVPRLAALHVRLRAGGARPAIVGPRPTDWAGKAMKSPPGQGSGKDGVEIEYASRVQFVISSGSLVDCEAAVAVGPFRADFFIDAIDVEWCMRANHCGYSIWIADEVLMAHELGRGVIRLPFGLLLTDQPPRRLYIFLRNQLVMVRLPHVPLRHKAKTLVALPMRLWIYLIRNRFSRETQTALWYGLLHGACDRLGSQEKVFSTLNRLRRQSDSAGQ